MFTQTWNKYLPVLKILLKRSVNGEQSMNMNGTDFQRAAGGRKVKFSFSVVMRKGRLQSLDNPPPLARDFADSLQNDVVTRDLVRDQEFEFSLNNSFQFTIKNLTAASTAAADETQS
jgi:hypothetical protein